MGKQISKTPLQNAAHYAVVLRPWITEKATMGAGYNHATFEVALDATKPQIKAAVEHIFNVTVLGVNTSVLKGKTKRVLGRIGVRSDRKKAVVRLKDGQSIDVASGV